MRQFLLYCLLFCTYSSFAQKTDFKEDIWDENEYAVEHYVLISVQQSAASGQSELGDWLDDLGKLPPIIPPPPPPLPCPEMVNCPDFIKGLGRMVTPQDRPFSIEINAATPSRSLKGKTLIASGKSTKAASKYYKGYRQVKLSVEKPKYRGMVVATLKDLKTGEVYKLRFKM